jgi:lipopolysaccharide export system permease protein
MRNHLDRYVFREITQTWLAVTIVLLVIMIANVLARTLSKVTDGTVAPEMLLALVAVKSVNLLVTLIPLGLYLGVLLGFGRLYRDSEMSAIAACGAGLKALYRPAIVAGLIGVVLIGILTIWVSPWAARYERVLADQIASRSVAGLLNAGRFVELLDGKAVVFTESLAENKQQFENIFVHRELADGSFEVETASYAVYQHDELTGDEFIVFVDGASTVAQPGSSQYRTTRFAQHGIKLPERESTSSVGKVESFSMTSLWQSDSQAASAELQWRISIPLAAVLLAILAVPLSHTSPRQGRYSRIALAILIYVPYANLLVLSRKWIAAGTLSPVIGLWWVHILLLALAAILAVKLYGISWITGKSGDRGALA